MPSVNQEKLRAIKSIPALIAYLRDELDWPVESSELDELTFDWSADQLRVSDSQARRLADGVIRQLRPLANNQPWGIFIVEFSDETFQRGALREILRGLVANRRRDPSLPSWQQDNLLFICATRDYDWITFAHYRGERSRKARLALFGWQSGSSYLRTLCEFNLPHLRWPENTADTSAWLKQWASAFDKEPLTREFYREISNWYFWALKHVEFPKDAPKEADGHDHISVIRLITRLIFCWFIREKGLIPEALFDACTLAETLIGFAPDKAKQKDSVFYRAILQNLFFATLNTEMDKREWAKEDQNFMAHNLYRHKECFKKPKGALQLFKNIPFLNGGLFECLDKDFGENAKPRYLRIDGFSRRADSQPTVPDFLFFGPEQEVDLSMDYGDKKYRKAVVRGLIHTLKRYNFTIEENTPLDQEVALDPELCGKVFENLLAAYNPETGTTARKATGSFYTPREIVDYMVDESLVAFLKERFNGGGPRSVVAGKSTDTTNGVPPNDAESRIRQLLAYTDEPHGFDEAETEKLIDAIDTLKALDPAVGSGAFPMGILHKLVFILGKIDPRNEKWKERQIKRVRDAIATAEKIEDASIRERTIEDLETQIDGINDAFEHNELDYGRKLYLIENCIYGVDIQPIAVQIAKMRFFISLIVDQKVDPSKPNLGVRALPNLETKFVAANTLIGIEKQERQGDLLTEDTGAHRKLKILRERLLEVRHKHFTAKTNLTKAKYRDQDRNIRQEIAGLLKAAGQSAVQSRQLAGWDPYDQNASADFFDPEWMFGVRDGFDIVIGNPPWGQKAVEFSIEEKNYFRQHYLTARGIFDIFRLFCECGLRLTRMNGAWAMILPDIILLKNYEETRRMFLSQTAIQIIAHTGMAFEAAQIDSVVIVARKAPQSQTTPQKVKAIHEFRGDPDQQPDLVLPQALFWKLDGLKFNIHLSPERLSLLKKLQQLPKLSECFHAHEGIHSGNIREKLFLDTQRNKSCRKLIFGRDEIGKFRVSWGGKWVNYNPAVIDREAGEYANLGHLEYFESPKVFVRRTGDFVMATVDRSGLFASNNLFVILQHRYSGRFSLEALTGILNSQLITWFFRAIQPRVGKLFAELKINQLHQFPLPPAAHYQEATKTISPLVERILAAKRSNPAADVSALESEINQVVYRLYGLTEEEIKIVEQSKRK